MKSEYEKASEIYALVVAGTIFVIGLLGGILAASFILDPRIF